MTKQYNFGPWEIWNGGEWDGDPDELVQVQLDINTREQAETNMVLPASQWFWGPVYIICFRRVIKPKVHKIVRYLNVYSDGWTGLCSTREDADYFAKTKRFACVRIELDVEEGQFDD